MTPFLLIIIGLLATNTIILGLGICAARRAVYAGAARQPAARVASGEASMTRELDALCARAMGLEKRVSVLGVPKVRYAWPTPESSWPDPPPYSSSLEAARSLEDAIEQWGLWSKYIPRLIEYVNDVEWTRPEEYLLGYSLTNGVPHLFQGNVWGMAALIRATPEQKARAFLKAVS